METQRINISELSCDPANVRAHDGKNLDAIKASLQRFGQQKPIVVDEKGVVIAGNGTLTAARALGWDAINIVRTELAGAEATAYAIADNRTAELAEWDDEALAKQLSALQIEDEALVEAAGFSDAELTALVDEVTGITEGNTDPDEVPEVPEEPTAQLGQIWKLGDHRLMCGDSTSAEDVDALMDGEKAELCLTDPPYGLGDTQSDKNNYDTHDDTKENLIELIGQFIPLAKRYTDRQVITPGNGNVYHYPKTDWTMAWFTPAGVGRGPWGFCCWQPVLCYGKDPKLSSGKGCHPDAIVHTEASENFGHPCSKPINFWKWLLERCSNGDHAVLDLFMGSGTTLIACEQTGRKCYGMELSPAYCDVIIKRWEDFTGQTAELVNG